MPGKLSTIVNNISTIQNKENQARVKEFYELMKSSGLQRNIKIIT